MTCNSGPEVLSHNSKLNVWTLMWVCKAKVGFIKKCYRKWALRKKWKIKDKREKPTLVGEVSQREINPWSFLSRAFIWPWQNLTKADVIAMRLFSPLGSPGVSWWKPQPGKWACNSHMLPIRFGMVIKCPVCLSLNCALLAADLDSLLVVIPGWS